MAWYPDTALSDVGAAALGWAFSPVVLCATGWGAVVVVSRLLTAVSRMPVWVSAGD
jgi:hypothetical protein